MELVVVDWYHREFMPGLKRKLKFIIAILLLGGFLTLGYEAFYCLLMFTKIMRVFRQTSQTFRHK